MKLSYITESLSSEEMQILDALNRGETEKGDNLYDSVSAPLTQIMLSESISATDIVKKILGDKVTSDIDELDKVPYLVTRHWHRTDSSGFVGFENPKQGTIGLLNPDSSDIEDIVSAAHEAHHAIAHWEGIEKPDRVDNEKLVNSITAKWLIDNYEGDTLARMLSLLDKWESSYTKNNSSEYSSMLTKSAPDIKTS